MEVTPALTEDAKNRALRTGLQALAMEVLIQVLPALYDLAGNEDIHWDLQVVESLVRVAVMAALSFLMRRFVDPSRIPSPLPPTPQPQPATEDPAP